MHGINDQFEHKASASCARPEERELMHQHAKCCAAAELEVCIAKKEAAVADAAVAAVAKVGSPVAQHGKFTRCATLITPVNRSCTGHTEWFASAQYDIVVPLGLYICQCRPVCATIVKIMSNSCGWHEAVTTLLLLVAQVLAAKQAASKTAKAAVSKADKRLKQLQTQACEHL